MGQQLDNPNTPVLDNSGAASRLTVFNPSESPSTYTTALASMDASRGTANLHPMTIDGMPNAAKSGASDTTAANAADNTAKGGNTAKGADAHGKTIAPDKYAGMSNDDVLKTLPQDQADFAREALKKVPNGHVMEGMHPGEIAVANFQMSKEDKQALTQFTDQMMAQGKTHGKCTLPDGTVVDVTIVPRGSTAPGAPALPGKQSPQDNPDDPASGTNPNNKKGKQYVMAEPDTPTVI